MPVSVRFLTVFFLIGLLCFSEKGIAQVSLKDLAGELSGSDLNKIKKAENTAHKGKDIEIEADKLKSSGLSDKEMAKNEKKYNLKRLEASQYYQNSNYEIFNLLKDNVNRFWKGYKGNSGLLSNIKNKEDKANELFRSAKALRKVAEDLVYPEEKLVKILEAEKNEEEAINVFSKVLYAYIHNPIEYDHLVSSPVNPSKEPVAEVIQPPAPKDSTPKIVSDTIPVVTPPKTETKNITTQLPDKDTTNKVQAPVIQKPANDQAQAVVPANNLKQDDKQISKNIPKLKTDSTSNKTAAQKMLPIQREKQSDTIEKVTVVPEKVPTQKEAATIPVTKAQNPTQDQGSLYGRVKVNEDQIDKFNKFLQTQYPNTYENYLINFQKLDYSNIDSMRAAWDTYLASRREQPEMAGNQNDSLLLAQMKKAKDAKDTEEAGGVNQSKNNKSIAHQKTADKKSRAINRQAESQQAIVEEPATGFIFKVQIAACKVPMSPAFLKHIYNGKLPILELHEDNWYKYVIGEFNTYRQARSLRDSVKVPGGFVIAYLNGTRIRITVPMTRNKMN